jgi:hypothetical protein|tara:strand:+ start:208 stop:684 length:477 start_codon:yes stop_codon:yes gene_type:complete
MAKKETLGAYLNRNIKELGSTLSKEKAKGKKYKSISAAKKAGALYYTNKAGKIMAAVYGEDLKVRPAASELMNSGIKKTRLPPAGIVKKIRQGPPGYTRGATIKNDNDSTSSASANKKPKPAVKPNKEQTVPKNKGGPVSKKPKGAYMYGGMAAKKKK